MFSLSRCFRSWLQISSHVSRSLQNSICARDGTQGEDRTGARSFVDHAASHKVSLRQSRNRTRSRTISKPSPSAPPTLPRPSAGLHAADGSHLRQPHESLTCEERVTNLVFNLGADLMDRIGPLTSGFLCGAVTQSHFARLLSSLNSAHNSDEDSTRCNANETITKSYGSTSPPSSASGGSDDPGGGSNPATTSANESSRQGKPVRAR